MDHIGGNVEKPQNGKNRKTVKTVKEKMNKTVNKTAKAHGRKTAGTLPQQETGDKN